MQFCAVLVMFLSDNDAAAAAASIGAVGVVSSLAAAATAAASAAAGDGFTIVEDFPYTVHACYAGLDMFEQLCAGDLSRAEPLLVQLAGALCTFAAALPRGLSVRGGDVQAQILGCLADAQPGLCALQGYCVQLCRFYTVLLLKNPAEFALLLDAVIALGQFGLGEFGAEHQTPSLS